MRETQTPYLGGPELFSRRNLALTGGPLEYASVAKALYEAGEALTEDDLLLQAGSLVIKYHLGTGGNFSVSGNHLRRGLNILTDLGIVQQEEDKISLTPAGLYLCEILSLPPSPVESIVR